MIKLVKLNLGKDICDGCGEKDERLFHVVFKDGEELDTCPICTGCYFDEIPEQVKSVEAK